MGLLFRYLQHALQRLQQVVQPPRVHRAGMRAGRRRRHGSSRARVGQLRQRRCWPQRLRLQGRFWHCVRRRRRSLRQHTLRLVPLGGRRLRRSARIRGCCGGRCSLAGSTRLGRGRV